jgi:hypothetical protein
VNTDYFVVSHHCPDLFLTVKSIFSEAGVRDIKVISADLRKSSDKSEKNN